ncbi:hypothetical protein ABIE26_004261 [Pedobacter africanus]|uniref:Uncharacterized protein n=1 Tax=Pedobacter africanus TaxID=151894 RepID=A0ACC6L2I7_9SPHI|nr:DUF5017 domain-containing protein [Pedobacter africanus]MDR6785551.1 hypothetical protein [Pedobacter africanus]
MKSLYILLLFALTFSSCKDELAVNPPDLSIATEKNAYKVGEEVKFKIEGDAQLISFYSGEPLHDYTFREGRIVQPGKLRLSFQSSVEFGTQQGQFSVLVSTDFNGGSSFSDIQLANWTDITSRFTLATTAVFTYSREIDITDLAANAQTIFIAFRYKVKDQGVYGIGRTWRVENFLLNSESSVGLQKKGDIPTSGFRLFDKQANIAPSRSTLSNSRISLVAHSVTDANRNLETENWAISKGFSIGTQDYGPDRPVPIKGIADSKISTYKYVYTKEGIYKAVFIGYNANISGSAELKKELTVTINP